MSLKARRSLFRELFDMEFWDVWIDEQDDVVVFVIEKARNNVVLDLDCYHWSKVQKKITSLGQEKTDLVLTEDMVSIEVVVPYENLPENYDD